MNRGPTVKCQLKVLHVEDSEAESLLLQRQIAKEFDVTVVRVDTEAHLKSRFAEGGWDLVVSDYEMPAFNGIRALQLVRKLDAEIPFIMVTGKVGEEVAVESIKLGADDYLLKDRLTRLVPAICKALAEARMRREYRQARSERHKHRAEIDAQLQFVTTLLDAIPSPVFYKDADLRYTGCNKAFEHFMGRPAAELIGRTVHEVAPRELADVYDAQDRDLLRHPGKQIYPYQVKTRNGLRDVIFYKATIPGPDGAVRGLVGVLADVTDQKDSERQVAQARDRLERVFAAAPIGMILLDETTRVVKANQAVASMVLRDPAEIIGQRGGGSLGCVHSYEDPKGCGFGTACPLCPLRNSVESVIRDRVARRGVEINPVVRVNGVDQTVWLRVNVEPVEIDGRPHTIVSIDDISVEKKAQQAVEESKAQLEETLGKLRHMAEEAGKANRAKSLFLADMSHEIRTPMNGVLGMLTLLEGTSLSNEQAGYLVTARRSAESLLALLNDLLDISRIEAGKLTLEPADFSPRALLQDVVLLMEPGAKRKGLKMGFTIDAAVPATLRADPVRLRQVLVNLLSNAVKFTDHGQIRVSLVPERHGQKVYVCGRVRDTGIGIPETEQKRLFKPFSRGEKESTRIRGGTGLGLAISRRIIEAMGGEIGVTSPAAWPESELAGGSAGAEFWFRIPMAAPEMQRAEPEPVQALAPADVLTVAGLADAVILVADDAPVNRVVAVGMLRQLGCGNVLEAADGEQTLRVLGEQRVDLVLLDVLMPGMDGYDVTRAIRRMDGHANALVPVVGLTALAMQGDREKALQVGMNDYLIKPLVKRELVKVLRRWLPATAVPVFSPDALCERLAGDRELINRILGVFRNDFGNTHADLKRHLADGSIREAHRLAHSMKSASLQVGGERLGRWMADLERVLDVGDLEAARSMESGIGDLYAALDRAIGRYYPDVVAGQSKGSPS